MINHPPFGEGLCRVTGTCYGDNDVSIVDTTRTLETIS